MNKRLKVGSILAGATLAVTTLAGTAGAATNLLTNGDLRPTTAGWTVSGPGTFQSIAGVGGRLTSTEVTRGESSVVASQCVAIDTDHNYRLTGSHRSLLEQDRSGWGYYLARFHTGEGCTGDIPDQKSHGIQQVDTWQPVDIQLTRTSGVPVKSVTIALVVKKDSTNRFIRKAGTFSIAFKDLALYGEPIPPSGGGQASDGTDGPACLIGFDCDDEDEGDAPDGPVVCIGCEDDPELPPAPPVEEPAAPIEPDFPMPPGDAPDDQDVPAAPDGPDGPVGPGAPSSDEPTTDDNSGQPSSGGGQPTSGEANPVTSGGKPQAKPTLEPQGPGPIQQAPPTLEPQGPGPINSASPTPPPPATGGDSDRDPAGDFSNGEGDSAEVERDNNDNDGLPMPLLGGGLAGLLALLGLGIVLGRSRRR